MVWRNILDTIKNLSNLQYTDSTLTAYDCIDFDSQTMSYSFRIVFTSKPIPSGQNHSLLSIAFDLSLIEYLALYEIHNLSNCPDNPTKLIDKFCDIWYFIMTFAFLLILVVLAVSCYYCTHRIDRILSDLNRQIDGVNGSFALITNDPDFIKLIQFKVLEKQQKKIFIQ